MNSQAEKLTFQPGAIAYVPLHGLCQVLREEKTEILGSLHQFTVFQPEADEALLKVPSDQMGARGIRPLADADELESQLCESNPEKLEIPRAKPHHRMRFWKRNLKSGTLESRRAVLDALDTIETNGGRLSKDENALKERLTHNFRRELEQVLELTGEQALNRLSRLFRQPLSVAAV